MCADIFLWDRIERIAKTTVVSLLTWSSSKVLVRGKRGTEGGGACFAAAQTAGTDSPATEIYDHN